MTRKEALYLLEEVKTIDDSIYQYNPKYLEALNVAIKSIKDVEFYNECNFDLASENNDLEERIGKIIDFIMFLKRTGQGKKKSLDILEGFVSGQVEGIKADGENFLLPKKNEWIPVGEKLPDKSGLYLICFDELVTVANYGGHKFFSRSADVEIQPKAWMPLPKPYGLESEEV